MMKKLMTGLVFVMGGLFVFVGALALFLAIQGRLSPVGLAQILDPESAGMEAAEADDAGEGEPATVESDEQSDGVEGEDSIKTGDEEMDDLSELEGSSGMRDLKDRLATEWSGPPPSKAYTPYGELQHLSSRMFQIPSPFSSEDLNSLVDELKRNLRNVQQRIVNLAKSQEEVDQMELDFEARLKELQIELEKLQWMSQEVEANKRSIEKTVIVLQDNEAASLKSLAKIYEGMDAQSVVNAMSKMGDVESAKILSKMSPRSAAEALSAMDATKASQLSLLLKNLISGSQLKGKK